jgi:hypothetical protein
MNDESAKKIARATAQIREVRAAIELLPAGEEKALAGFKINHIAQEFARGIAHAVKPRK